MARADLSAARAAAQAAREAASGRRAAAIDAAREAKEAARLKPVQLVDMPEPTGGAEADSAADLDAIQHGFRARAADEKKRRRLATDSEYWVAMCFQTREQKERFLAAMKLSDLGDKYINGEAVARRLGVDLPPADVPYNAGDNGNQWGEFVVKD